MAVGRRRFVGYGHGEADRAGDHRLEPSREADRASVKMPSRRQQQCHRRPLDSSAKRAAADGSRLCRGETCRNWRFSGFLLTSSHR